MEIFAIDNERVMIDSGSDEDDRGYMDMYNELHAE
jgi:hypothetical protein